MALLLNGQRLLFVALAAEAGAGAIVRAEAHLRLLAGELLGVGVRHLAFGGGGQVARNSVLCLHSGVHEFLRSLLELLLRRLGIRIGGPCLVLYLYVDWLPVGTSLLSLLLLGLR